MFWGRQVGHVGDRAPGVQRAAWLGVWPIATSIALGDAGGGLLPGRTPALAAVAAGGRLVLVAGCRVVRCCRCCGRWSTRPPGSGSPHPFAGDAPAPWRRCGRASRTRRTPPSRCCGRSRSGRGGEAHRGGYAVSWRGCSSPRRGRRWCWWWDLSGGAPRRPGLIAVTMVPVAAGLAVVHGQHAAAYAALTWMSRRGPGRRTTCRPTSRGRRRRRSAAPAVLWLGSADVAATGRRLAADAGRPGTPRRAAAGLPADRPRRRPRRRADGRPGRPHGRRGPDPRRPRRPGRRWSCSTSRSASWSSRSGSPGTSRA